MAQVWTGEHLVALVSRACMFVCVHWWWISRCVDVIHKEINVCMRYIYELAAASHTLLNELAINTNSAYNTKTYRGYATNMPNTNGSFFGGFPSICTCFVFGSSNSSSGDDSNDTMVTNAMMICALTLRHAFNIVLVTPLSLLLFCYCECSFAVMFWCCYLRYIYIYMYIWVNSVLGSQEHLLTARKSFVQNCKRLYAANRSKAATKHWEKLPSLVPMCKMWILQLLTNERPTK